MRKYESYSRNDILCSPSFLRIGILSHISAPTTSSSVEAGLDSGCLKIYRLIVDGFRRTNITWPMSIMVFLQCANFWVSIFLPAPPRPNEIDDRPLDELFRRAASARLLGIAAILYAIRTVQVSHC